MKAKKSIGPKKVPCGTLDWTGPVRYLTINNDSLSPVHEEGLYPKVLLLTPEFRNFAISLLCGTLSKAFEKSRTSMSILCLLCSYTSVVKRAVLQDTWIQYNLIQYTLIQ